VSKYASRVDVPPISPARTSIRAPFPRLFLPSIRETVLRLLLPRLVPHDPCLQEGVCHGEHHRSDKESDDAESDETPDDTGEDQQRKVGPFLDEDRAMKLTLFRNRKDDYD
jgi:hypothetical protein